MLERDVLGMWFQEAERYGARTMIVFFRRNRESSSGRVRLYHHVGSCPPCQRAQLERWREQQATVTPRLPA
ncbi:MAG: hypothetical protein ACLP01_11775 [Solirubrobacteraceae bacterium]